MNRQQRKPVKPKSWLFEYPEIFDSSVKPVKEKIKPPINITRE